MIVSTPSGTGILSELFDDDGRHTRSIERAAAFVAELLEGPHEGQFFAGAIEDLVEVELH